VSGDRDLSEAMLATATVLVPRSFLDQLGA